MWTVVITGFGDIFISKNILVLKIIMKRGKWRLFVLITYDQAQGMIY